MQNKYNHFFNFFLFSGLACFSHLFLVLYSDLSPQHQNVLISFWAFLLVVFVFNVIGFSIILISEWQRKSYQVLMKRNNQLLINCLLMAGLLFLINYLLSSVVKVLLENYSYDVLDLGKDVAPEAIVEETIKNHVRLVGLSALMTTTVPSMEETIKQLRKEAPWAKVMVGGAVLTQEYADMIGADAYCRDAMASVNYAQQVLV